jgi:hypothetical protein
LHEEKLNLDDVVAAAAYPTGCRAAQTCDATSLAKIVAALKRHGVELLPETEDHGAGVRWILPRAQRPWSSPEI